MGYPQLRMITDFSFRRGASTISDIVSAASENAVPALAITDLASMSGVLAFSDYASSKGIQPIMGCDINIIEDGNSMRTDKISGHVVILAMNNVGYTNICKILEKSYTPIENKGHKSLPSDPFVSIDFLCENSEGVILLTGIREKGLAYSLATHHNGGPRIQQIHNAFGSRVYIEFCRDIGKPTQYECEDILFNLADGQYDVAFPICATVDIQYAREEDASTWHLLRASKDGQTVIIDNNGHVESDNPGLYIPDAETFEELFADIPDAIENTVGIASRCSYMAEKRNPVLPNYEVPQGETIESHLLDESIKGLQSRMKNRMDEYQEYENRLRFEIDVINKMGFPGYFLIVSDFIRWAKSNEIPVGPGRGSGAGSVVAWALLITDVDPIFHGLLFERFLNPERVSMPDFDIDFCTNRRGEVIDYVRKKYGDDHVCMIATFGKIMAKTAVDDVQRCVVSDAGFALGRGDAAILKAPFTHLKTANMSLKKAVMGGTTDIEKEMCTPFLNALGERKDTLEDLYPFLNASMKIEGLSRNQSQHAAGVVIGDRPLYELFPVIRDEKNLSTMSAFSGKYVELAGGVKFDFLGLKNLTIIDETIKIAKKKYGAKNVIDPRELTDFDDKNHIDLYRMVREGKTVGVFQLSSPGMSKTLADVGPTCFADIVAIVSLYRPGPMAIIPDYADRKHGRQKVIYPVEKFTKDILEPTYGFMVYQEQVMQIAMSCAGYTLGGADLLRRAMGKKIREEMEKQRSVFVEGCSKNDIPANEANDLFDTISKFADYGFNKSHAVAYSIVAWQTMFLKLYYPECFYSALITLSPDSIPRIVDEMKTMSPAITLTAPDVNKSQIDAWPVNKTTISCGLAVISTMKNTSEKLVQERGNKPFVDIVDFGSRAGKILPTATYKYLAEVGALDCFWTGDGVPNRRKLAGLAEWFSAGNKKQDARQASLLDMFSTDEIDIKWPVMAKEIASFSKDKELVDLTFEQVEDWRDRDLRAMKSLGFWIDGHPINSKIGILVNMGVRPMNTWNIFMKIMEVGNLENRLTALTIESVEEDYTYAKDGIPSLKVKAHDGMNTVYLRYFHSVRGNAESYTENARLSKEKYKKIRMVLDEAQNSGAVTVATCSLKYLNIPGKNWREQLPKANLTDIFFFKDFDKNVYKDWVLVLESQNPDDYKHLYSFLMTHKTKDSSIGGTVTVLHDNKEKIIMDDDNRPVKFSLNEDICKDVCFNYGVNHYYCPAEEQLKNESGIISNEVDIEEDAPEGPSDIINSDFRTKNLEKVFKEKEYV